MLIVLSPEHKENLQFLGTLDIEGISDPLAPVFYRRSLTNLCWQWHPLATTVL